MMTTVQQEKLEYVTQHYTFEQQREILVEECAELIQAVQKCKRYPTNDQWNTNFVEELADVLICAEQMRLYLKPTNDEISKWIDFKLNRELKRIVEEKKNDE